MKKLMICLMMLSFLAVPISGITAIFQNNPAVGVKSPGTCPRENKMELSENGNNEDDDATDDGEDRMDGDSDSNSDEDSDGDNTSDTSLLVPVEVQDFEPLLTRSNGAVSKKS